MLRRPGPFGTTFFLFGLLFLAYCAFLLAFLSNHPDFGFILPKNTPTSPKREIPMQLHLEYPKSSLQRVFVVTVTMPRHRANAERFEYMRRHLSTLSKDSNVFWLVAEDSPSTNDTLRNLLKCGDVPYHYFSTPPLHLSGAPQRNAANDFIAERKGSGLIYILDDDNMIDHRLLGLMRTLSQDKRIGVFPIGNLGTDGVERPNVTADGRIVGFNSRWPQREFPVDVGAIVMSTAALYERDQPPKWFHGLYGGETEFLQQFLAGWSDLQPLGDPHALLAWHNEEMHPSDDVFPFQSCGLIIEAIEDSPPTDPFERNQRIYGGGRVSPWWQPSCDSNGSKGCVRIPATTSTIAFRFSHLFDHQKAEIGPIEMRAGEGIKGTHVVTQFGQLDGNVVDSAGRIAVAKIECDPHFNGEVPVEFSIKHKGEIINWHAIKVC